MKRVLIIFVAVLLLSVNALSQQTTSVSSTGDPETQTLHLNLDNYIKMVVEALLPELARVMDDPRQREQLKSRLARAISHRYGATNWTEFGDDRPSASYPR